MKTGQAAVTECERDRLFSAAASWRSDVPVGAERTRMVWKVDIVDAQHGKLRIMQAGSEE